mgnify:CR=1 FL=1
MDKIKIVNKFKLDQIIIYAYKTEEGNIVWSIKTK